MCLACWACLIAMNNTEHNLRATMTPTFTFTDLVSSCQRYYFVFTHSSMTFLLLKTNLTSLLPSFEEGSWNWNINCFSFYRHRTAEYFQHYFIFFNFPSSVVCFIFYPLHYILICSVWVTPQDPSPATPLVYYILIAVCGWHASWFPQTFQISTRH